jgi:hypothetical protein
MVCPEGRQHYRRVNPTGPELTDLLPRCDATVVASLFDDALDPLEGRPHVTQIPSLTQVAQEFQRPED